MIEKQLYRYRAEVVSVYDGDTCTLDVDLGFNTWIKSEKFRLLRINAKEVRGEEKIDGLLAKDFLQKLLSQYKNIYIETVKDKKEKYGRYLAELIIVKEDGTELNVNDHLVQNGFAEYKEY